MTENASAYRRIHRARGALLIACVEAFGATASDAELAVFSGLERNRIQQALERLEKAGRIRRETLGRKRRIVVLGRKGAEPKAEAAPKSGTGGTGESGRKPAGASIAPSGLPPNKLPGRRICMMCREPFHSEHAGNRLCRRCKSTAACQTTPFDP